MQFKELIINEQRFHKNSTQFLHAHEDILQLVYVMKGEGIYFVHDRCYPAHEGILLICNAGTLHGKLSWKNDELVTCCCDYKKNSLEKGKMIPDGADAVLRFHGNEKKVFDKLFEAMQLMDNSPDTNGLKKDIAEIIYKRVNQRLEERITEQSQEKSKKNIFDILTYIDLHYMEKISIAQLSETFLMSESSIAHLFKQEIGMAVLKYINMRRLGEAQILLINTMMSVRDIALSLAFGDIAHFSAGFKKHVGISPTEYRKKYND